MNSNFSVSRRWARSRVLLLSATIVALTVGSSPAQGTVPSTYLDCLKDFERYAESVWHDATYANKPPDSGYFGDGRSDGNGGIRGSCGIAVAYAVLVRSDPRDAKNSLRLDRLRKAINYAAHTHASTASTNACVDGKKWGKGWQSSLWAGSMGLACLLVQEQLPPGTVAACQRAVAGEASFRARIPPASGYKRDTKAEENAWNANIVALAAGWLRGSTNAPLWLKSAKQYLVNSYTAADTHGDVLAEWVTTQTVFPSFAVENHGFYHPTYQLDPGSSMGDSLLMAHVANRTVAEELQPFAEHNVLNVWRHLSQVILDSGELAYPSGVDWSLHNYEQTCYFAFLSSHFNDPLARWTEEQMAKLLRHRQQVNGDGRFIGDSLPDGFYHEAVDARQTAIAWLHYQYGRFPSGPATRPGAHLTHSPDIKLITQRSPAGFFSISYGPKIMGLLVPPTVSIPTNVYVTTPRSPGLIGIGPFGPPENADLLWLQTNSTGFEAEFCLVYKSNHRSMLSVKSVDHIVAMIEVPRASSPVTTAGVPSFSAGIENHALTGGSRQLEWAGGGTNIAERSGISINISNRWVCVSGQHGMVSGPAGYIRYQAASSYNRRGAAEDTLEFVPDEPLRAHFVVWLPGQNAVATKSRAAQVTWTESNTNGVLSFPGANGTTHQLQVALPH